MPNATTSLVVDSHTHLVSPDLARYPLRTAVPPAPLPPDAAQAMQRQSVEDFLRMMDASRIDRAVVVHSFGAYEFDCTFALDAGAACPERLRVVVQYDADAPDFAERLAAAATRPYVKGVRVTSMFHPWLLDESKAHIWDAIAETGLTVELVGGETAGLAWVIDRVAPLPVVLHGLRVADNPSVASLASRPNVWVKLSSHELLNAEAAEGDPAVLVERLAATVGAGRLMWGSNFPQTTARAYDGLVELGRRAVRTLSPEDRDAVLGGTAMQLWPW